VEDDQHKRALQSTRLVLKLI